MKWTDKDITFLQENFQSMAKPELAKKLKRSEAAISAKMRQLDLTDSGNSGKLSRLQSRYIAQNHQDLSVAELAEDLGVNESLINAAIKELRIGIAKPKQQGRAAKLMGTHSNDSRVAKNVCIMTPSASEAGDEVRQPGSTKNGPHIHKIHEE